MAEDKDNKITPARSSVPEHVMREAEFKAQKDYNAMQRESTARKVAAEFGQEYEAPPEVKVEEPGYIKASKDGYKTSYYSGEEADRESAPIAVEKGNQRDTQSSNKTSKTVAIDQKDLDNAMKAMGKIKGSPSDSQANEAASVTHMPDVSSGKSNSR